MERAKQLKRQQKVLREQEWNAKPEYEKRRMVVSVDLVGGKVVKRMGDVEKPADEEEGEDEEVVEEDAGHESSTNGGGGIFSKNPLMGGLIRPVWKGKGKDTEIDGTNGHEEKESARSRKSVWRRMQDDDDDDNEGIILNGGIYGGNDLERRLGDEEHAEG